MATRFAFMLVVGLFVSGSKIPGRLELLNPDVSVTSVAARTTAKRAPVSPQL